MLGFLIVKTDQLIYLFTKHVHEISKHIEINDFLSGGKIRKNNPGRFDQFLPLAGGRVSEEEKETRHDDRMTKTATRNYEM